MSREKYLETSRVLSFKNEETLQKEVHSEIYLKENLRSIDDDFTKTLFFSFFTILRSIALLH